MAKELAKGVTSVDNVEATIKQVKASDHEMLKDISVASVEELASYDGIAFGSPVYFGNISTGMSEFLSGTTTLWTNHALEGMPATVFMSAGSGAGNELAVQSFYQSLAVHGMVLVPNGIRGYEAIDTSNPQGNTVWGITSFASSKSVDRPSSSERHLAALQGMNFAKVALALQDLGSKHEITTKDQSMDPNTVLKQKGIILPQVPTPAGSYQPFARSGDLVFINQVPLENGKILHPGKLGTVLDEQQIKEATTVAMLNVLSVLNEAIGCDLNRVKRCVQLTGIFNTRDDYTRHAELMDVASDLAVEVFGEKGKHARATFGASSLPLDASVEIQAVFEVR